MDKDTDAKGEGIISRMALNDNKAGMEGLDRDKINAIIMEASKGSRFYENELKRDQQVNQRIEKMMRQKASITEEQLQKAQLKVENMVTELEKHRDLSRVIVHVDMDAFYAAVEMRDCPELKDKPMAVGSMSMLSTSNYQARKYGVRAAMPGFIAKKLCPNLVIVPTNFDKYRAVSKEVRAIFSEYDPNFQPVSLDEAYLDFTEHLEQRKSWPESACTHYYSNRTNNNGEAQMEPVDTTEVTDLSPVLFEDSPSSSPVLTSCGSEANVGKMFEVFGTSAEEAVREMRFRIEQKTKLTASAGIAPNMMLAKVCSDKNKPNGQYRLPPTRDAVMDFIHNLPVRKVPGIGKVSEKMLKALGIYNCFDLGQQMVLLSLLFSETAWHHFIELSLGLSSTFIPRNEERKSMSTERTFKELSHPEEQFALCRELCEDLAEDMKKEGLKGKTVTVKLKNVNFEVKTRAMTVQCAVATAQEIYAIAKDLLNTEIENVAPHLLRLRLMGVRVSTFVSIEDKRPLQKSIVGFFHQGKKDYSAPGGSLQEPSQKLEKPNFLRQNKEDVQEEHKTSDKPKLSFFQMAQAKRLQVEAAKAASQNIDTMEKPCTSVNNEQSNNEILTEKLAPQNASLLIKDQNKRQKVSPSPQPQPSTSGCGIPSSEGLTCPVCFCQVKTTNLNIFNNHIDLCLKGATTRPDQNTDSESDLSSQNTDTQFFIPDKHNLEENKKTEVFKQDFSKINPQEGYKNGNSALDSHDDIGSEQPKSCDDKCSILICPVCHKTQDTNDLTAFNHHVDLCLNQEVLHKLEQQTIMPEKPVLVTVTNNKGTVSNPPMRKTTKGKTKRRDSPSSPPSKKAKGHGPRNTIDQFFR
ncbi:DNA polymerase kappa [Periophthalmus magnuspinnatus]|uniref:DNA polymerase kappa n=1 Tax=Periophthalmus magnuspinnatus TaxID=409849 RepID=UPI00243717DF|nr:DNA polymerase kappa [Periophthalmus magnuspinnatus]